MEKRYVLSREWNIPRGRLTAGSGLEPEDSHRGELRDEPGREGRRGGEDWRREKVRGAQGKSQTPKKQNPGYTALH